MQHYHGLDLLRFIAALMVVFFHLSYTQGATMGWPAGSADAPLFWMDSFGWFGWIGVQIFFVLSGFIISASAKNSSSLTFAKKRVIRVMPALWLAIPVALLARWAWGEPIAVLVDASIRSAILLPKGPYIDGVIWTLVVEAAFYGLIAVMLALPAKFGDFDRKLTALALILGALSTAFITAQWVAANSALLGPSNPYAATLRWFGFDVLLLRHGAYFAFGMLMFQWLDGRQSKTKAAAMAVFGLACWLQISVMASGTGSVIPPIATWSAAVAFAAVSVRHGARALKWTGLWLTRPIGRLTYPLYLNHFVLSQATLPLIAPFVPNPYLLALVMLAGLLVLAFAIAVGPEAALQKWAKQRLLKKPIPRPSGTVQPAS